jgi:hypothetical protein
MVELVRAGRSPEALAAEFDPTSALWLFRQPQSRRNLRVFGEVAVPSRDVVGNGGGVVSG